MGIFFSWGNQLGAEEFGLEGCRYSSHTGKLIGCIKLRQAHFQKKSDFLPEQLV